MQPATEFETTADDAKQLIEKALAQEPRLTHFGIGVFDERKRRQAEGNAVVDAEIAAQRESLRAAVTEVQAAADWIKRQTKIASFNTRHTSYGYKHAVERWWRERGTQAYVANGSFIAAAIGLGWDPKLDTTSPNVMFRFSEKTVSTPALDA